MWRANIKCLGRRGNRGAREVRREGRQAERRTQGTLARCYIKQFVRVLHNTKVLSLQGLVGLVLCLSWIK